MPDPTGSPVLPGFSYTFSDTIISAGLAVVVVDTATSAPVSGTTSYDAGTLTATWTAASASPLSIDSTYRVTISGATAADGTPMIPTTFLFAPGAAARTTPLSSRGRRR